MVLLVDNSRELCERSRNSYLSMATRSNARRMEETHFVCLPTLRLDRR
jgi:hypothetical protein